MFKFLEKQQDQIQSDVNMAVDAAVTELRDEIDAKATELAYAKVADIMADNNLDDNDEDIHDELFTEVFDTIYSELGIY